MSISIFSVNREKSDIITYRSNYMVQIVASFHVMFRISKSDFKWIYV